MSNWKMIAEPRSYIFRWRSRFRRRRVCWSSLIIHNVKEKKIFWRLNLRLKILFIMRLDNAPGSAVGFTDKTSSGFGEMVSNSVLFTSPTPTLITKILSFSRGSTAWARFPSLGELLSVKTRRTFLAFGRLGISLKIVCVSCSAFFKTVGPEMGACLLIDCCNSPTLGGNVWLKLITLCKLLP